MKYDELALALYFLAAYGAFELLWALARIESVRPPSLRRAKAPLALAWGMLARLGADRLLLQVPVTGGIALAEPSTIAMALTILLGLGMTLSLAKAPSRSGMSGKAARALLGLASVFVLALIMGIAVSSLRGTGIAGAADTAIVFAAAFLLALSKLPLSGPMALLAFSAVPLAHVHYGYLFAALGLAVLAGFALRARGLDKPFFSRGDGSQATLFIASAVAALMLRLGALPPLAGLTAGVVAFSVVPFHAPGAGTGMQLAAFCAGAIALGAGPWEHPLELPTVFFLALAFHSVRKLAFGPDEKRSDAAPFGVLGAAAGFGAVGGAGVISYALARLLLALLPSRGDRLGEAKDPTEGMRVIAAIGKRENVLGILGFAQALECRPNPVRAVCVAAPKGSPGQDPLEAEEALVRVIAAGTQAGIQVLPSLVLASSPADGLARAALERNAEAFVLGWPSMTPGGEIDRPTLDQLAGSTRKAIFVVRNADLFAPSRRLIVAYPSTNESAPGFIPCTTTLERVWKTMSNPGYVAIGSEQSGRESLPGWRELVSRIKSMGPQKVALAIVAGKPGTRTWSPLAERLAIALYDHFPRVPTVFAYLADEEEAEGGEGPVQQPLRRPTEERALPALPALLAEASDEGRVFMAMSQAALVDALVVLARGIFPGDRIRADRLANEFSATARREPIELEPGTLLLHSHVEGIGSPTLALGHRVQGWRLAALSAPIRTVVMLVSPSGKDPEEHLNALTQLAKAFRDGYVQELVSRGQDEKA